MLSISEFGLKILYEYMLIVFSKLLIHGTWLSSQVNLRAIISICTFYICIISTLFVQR